MRLPHKSQVTIKPEGPTGDNIRLEKETKLMLQENRTNINRMTRNTQIKKKHSKEPRSLKYIHV